MVVFFPSYSYMERTVTTWDELGVLREVAEHKLLFVETKDVVETTIALDNFRRACDTGRGAVFLSIARGKVAEGIDFDRHYGRCVLNVGVPFQYTQSPVLRTRLEYLLSKFAIREADFLSFDALRQTASASAASSGRRRTTASSSSRTRASRATTSGRSCRAGSSSS